MKKFIFLLSIVMGYSYGMIVEDDYDKVLAVSHELKEILMQALESFSKKNSEQQQLQITAWKDQTIEARVFLASVAKLRKIFVENLGATLVEILCNSIIGKLDFSYYMELMESPRFNSIFEDIRNAICVLISQKYKEVLDVIIEPAVLVNKIGIILALMESEKNAEGKSYFFNSIDAQWLKALLKKMDLEDLLIKKEDKGTAAIEETESDESEEEGSEESSSKSSTDLKNSNSGDRNKDEFENDKKIERKQEEPSGILSNITQWLKRGKNWLWATLGLGATSVATYYLLKKYNQKK